MTSETTSCFEEASLGELVVQLQGTKSYSNQVILEEVDPGLRWEHNCEEVGVTMARIFTEIKPHNDITGLMLGYRVHKHRQ